MALRKNIQQSRRSEPEPNIELQSFNYRPDPSLQSGSKSSAQPALERHLPAASLSLSPQWKCQRCKTTNDGAHPNCLKCNRFRARPEAVQWRCTSCGWHNPRSGTRCAKCNSFNAGDAPIDELAKQWKHVRRYGRDEQSKPEPKAKREVDKLDAQATTGQRDRELGAEEERRRRIDQTSGGRFVGFRAATSEDAQSRGVQNQRPPKDTPRLRNVSKPSTHPMENVQSQQRLVYSPRQGEQDRKAEVSDSPKYSQNIRDDAELHSSRLQPSPDSLRSVRSGWATYRAEASTSTGEEKSQGPAPSSTSDLLRMTPNSQSGVKSSADTAGLESNASSVSSKELPGPPPAATSGGQDRISEGNLPNPRRARRVSRTVSWTAFSQKSDLQDAGHRDISWYEATSNSPSYSSLDRNTQWKATQRSQAAPATATYIPEDTIQHTEVSKSSETSRTNTGHANDGLVWFTPDQRVQPEAIDTNQRNHTSQQTSQLTPKSFMGTESTKMSDRYGSNERRAKSRADLKDGDTARYTNHAGNAAAPYAYERRSRKPRYAQDDYDDEAYEYDEDRQDARQRRKEQRKREKAAQRHALPPTPIYLPEFISVGNLARVLRVRVDDFARKMQDLGFEETNNDHLLDAEVAGLIAAEFNFEPIVDKFSENQDLQARPPAEDRSLLHPRPPIVTIMGHVDHGKTTLLDYLRKSSVAASEHGGITQHIGAFSVSMPGGRLITFLDTPGHAAFLSMRQRGANVTDIVILVVAADDSVKPQTIEAIKHAQAAKVPMIVAINKVDKEEKNTDLVKQDLARYGVEIEDFGGDTQVVCVSGKTGQGLNELEENIVALADILDMRAETDGQAEGWVLEGATKRAGRVATVLVRRGTIRRGDIIVAGSTWAKIRTLKNEAGAQVLHASPGTPVEVDGWKDQPTAGDEVLQARSEQQAKSAIDYRLAQVEKEQMAADMSAVNESRRLEQERKEATANVSPAPPATSTETSAVTDTLGPVSTTGEVKPVATPLTAGPTTLPIVLKADVSGSVEACLNAITGLGTSTITPLILRSSVGPISESDVTFAALSGAQIVSFNQTTTFEIYRLAEREGVKVVEENVIYRLTDLVKGKLEDLLPEKVESKVLGEAEIAKPFQIGIGGRKKMLVAGCRVRNGVVSRANKTKVLRGGVGGECVFDGEFSALYF